MRTFYYNEASPGKKKINEWIPFYIGMSWCTKIIGMSWCTKIIGMSWYTKIIGMSWSTKKLIRAFHLHRARALDTVNRHIPVIY